MDRRQFITGLVALTLSTRINSKSKQKKSFDVYIDESGDIGSQQPFVIGALLVESSYDYNKIKTIRKNTHFSQILNYTSSNKYKTKFSEPLLREFFSCSELNFFAMAFPKEINEKWSSEKKLRSVLYHRNYWNVLNRKGLSGVEINIYLERRTLTGEDEFLKNSIEKEFKSVRVKFIKDYESDCMQLCDLMTGSIYGYMNKVHDKTKISIINTLRSTMQRAELSKSFSFRKGKFELDVRRNI